MAVTSPQLAVVRFHGRRTEHWEAKGIPVDANYGTTNAREIAALLAD